MDAKRDEKFSKAETQKRFESALQGAFKTPPTPMNSLPRKRAKRKAKKAKP
jgi:hypothetical protein